MLAIRLQRMGRKGLPQYRMVVQDADRTPTSGRVIAYLGHFNPHTKEAVLDKEKAEFYLKNGAQPSDRAIGLLSQQGITMPKWVKEPSKKTKNTKNQDKLRKNQPKDDATEVSAPAEAEAEPSAAEVAAEPSAEDQAETKEA